MVVSRCGSLRLHLMEMSGTSILTAKIWDGINLLPSLRGTTAHVAGDSRLDNFTDEELQPAVILSRPVGARIDLHTGVEETRFLEGASWRRCLGSRLRSGVAGAPQGWDP